MAGGDLESSGAQQAVRALLSLARRNQSDRIIRGERGLRAWCEELSSTTQFQAARAAITAAGGSELTPSEVYSTGVAGLLASPERLDDSLLDRVATDLCAHLTRPYREHWQALALEATEIPSGVEIGEWRTWRPAREAKASFAPVPAAFAHSASAQKWPPDATAHAFLLCYVGPTDVGGARVKTRPDLHGWLPVFVLSAYAQATVRAPQILDLVKGGTIYVHGEDVVLALEPSDPDDPDSDEVKVPWRQDAPIIGSATTLQRYAHAITHRYKEVRAYGKHGEGKKIRQRFDRGAEQAVMAGTDSRPMAVDGGGVEAAHARAEVLLRYVIALEAVLSGKRSDNEEDEETGGVRGAVSRRAAALLSDPGAEGFNETFDQVAEAYHVRSRYVHEGETPPQHVDLGGLRDVVLQVLERWLIAIHADAHTRTKRDPRSRPDRALLEVLDAAESDPARRQSAIDRPVDDFASDIE